ncbi:hypothetical protein HD806DRAFT_551068 [Xylariaceae sp. AK1471]|nr:hypothetical protein HD806DRAFT_551068 [Xylariaceae sp. AK1471]
MTLHRNLKDLPIWHPSGATATGADTNSIHDVELPTSSSTILPRLSSRSIANNALVGGNIHAGVVYVQQNSCHHDQLQQREICNSFGQHAERMRGHYDRIEEEKEEDDLQDYNKHHSTNNGASCADSNQRKGNSGHQPPSSFNSTVRKFAKNLAMRSTAVGVLLLSLLLGVIFIFLWLGASSLSFGFPIAMQSNQKDDAGVAAPVMQTITTTSTIFAPCECRCACPTVVKPSLLPSTFSHSSSFCSPFFTAHMHAATNCANAPIASASSSSGDGDDHDHGDANQAQGQILEQEQDQDSESRIRRQIRNLSPNRDDIQQEVKEQQQQQQKQEQDQFDAHTCLWLLPLRHTSGKLQSGLARWIQVMTSGRQGRRAKHS